jgi:hypothetical protein
VFRDEELAGSPGSEQVDSYQDLRNHHGMHTVDCNGVNRMKIRHWFAIRPSECNVPANSLYCSAGFDPSHHIPSPQMLVFKAYVGLHKNSYFFQPPQRPLGQREPAMCDQVLFLCHSSVLTPSVAQV